ncbi:Neurochondrin-domain-containing protein [Syncephalis fuscata]|nr:Neurochondrin-domain-containing protein [Syncephalis fuscata]
MRSLAVNVLTFFARADSTLLEEKSMLERIPSLAHALDKCEGDQAEEARIDILELFVRATISLQGARWMWHVDVYQPVINQWINGLDDVSSRAFQVIQQCLLSTINLDKKSGRDINRVATFLCHLMPQLAKTCAERTDKRKIEGLQLLAYAMSTMPTAIIRLLNTNKNAYGAFVCSLQCLLGQILGSKSASEARDDAILLAAGMMEHFGDNWLFMPVVSEASSNESNMSATQLALLTVNLVGIEARLGVDELALIRNVETAASKIETKTKRIERLLPACFCILEHIIHFFATNLELIESSEDNSIDSQAWHIGVFNIEQVLQLQKTLHQTFEAVLAFLDDQLVKLSLDQACHDNLVLASVRALCIFLAEDESMHANTVCLIPLWIQLLTPPNEITKPASEDEETNIALNSASINTWLCPAIIHCLSQSVIRDAFKDGQGIARLSRWIAQRWSTITEELPNNKRIARQFVRQVTPCLDVLMTSLQIDWNDALIDELISNQRKADTMLASTLPDISATERQSLIATMVYIQKYRNQAK